MDVRTDGQTQIHRTFAKRGSNKTFQIVDIKLWIFLLPLYLVEDGNNVYLPIADNFCRQFPVNLAKCFRKAILSNTREQQLLKDELLVDFQRIKSETKQIISLQIF